MKRLIFFLILPNILFSQNIIKNWSFEYGANTPGWAWAGISYDEYLYDWEGENGPAHTPDWLAPDPINNPAPNGLYFAHATTHEIIQQKLSRKLSSASFYFFTMKIKIRDEDDLNLNKAYIDIYAANSKLKYKRNDLPAIGTTQCDDKDWRTFQNSPERVARIKLEGLTVDDWIDVGTYFKPSNSNYDWFGFEIAVDDNNDGDSCNQPKIFFDAVQLLSDPCSQKCVIKTENMRELPWGEINGYDNYPLTYGNQGNQIILQQDANPYVGVIENATFIEMKIFNRWGEQFRHKEYFDPNGLDNQAAGYYSTPQKQDN